MQRIDFSNYIKPLLRTCGLGLLAIFMVRIAFSYPLAAFTVPAQAIQLVTSFLDLSYILVIALMMLLLSMADRTQPRQARPDTKPMGLREKMIMRGRFLVGIVAILYVLIIPYSLV